MTTTERNDLLRHAFARLFGAVGVYDLSDLSAYEDHVTLSLHHELPWDNHENASVTFTFDEVCDTTIPELNALCQARFNEAIAEEERRTRETEERRLAKMRADDVAAKAARKAARLTKEQRDRAELARLKALYPET